MKHDTAFSFKKGFPEKMCQILPTGRDLGDSSLPIPGISKVRVRKPTGTRLNRVRGPKILGEYEAIPVPVTGICKPGNTREYPGNWQKGNTSSS